MLFLIDPGNPAVAGGNASRPLAGGRDGMGGLRAIRADVVAHSAPGYGPAQRNIIQFYGFVCDAN
jgi:hypothetical protein